MSMFSMGSNLRLRLASKPILVLLETQVDEMNCARPEALDDPFLASGRHPLSQEMILSMRGASSGYVAYRYSFGVRGGGKGGSGSMFISAVGC